MQYITQANYDAYYLRIMCYTILIMTKRERWDAIERLLLDHPEGLRQAELMRRTGASRSTISRDIMEMSLAYPVYEVHPGFFTMDKSGYLNEVRLTMHELEALHLSARLFLKLMRFPFPHASGALRKLADAQNRVSPALADRIRDTAEEIDGFITSKGERQYTEYSGVIEQLGIAISEKRPVTISYFSRKSKEDKQYIIAPVTLEPYPDGRTVYLISWAFQDSIPDFRTFKTERIRSLDVGASSPALFDSIPTRDLLTRFRNAWSIWTSKTGPVTVRLRFCHSVATRVAETLWHQSQIIINLPDGCIEWSARIDEPREMYPWIRGWGPDVIILEPAWLRDMHKADLSKGVDNYTKN